ncbi:MAG: undecaprenyl-diphosphate phosphatase [Candidatus Kerfeldbacteria bacterium]|nr:undecaprenyl-diphosphate phosphatase [Candidatus Kerfeldbacteria bacterium]
MHNFFIAVILGIVEGITEFLPISSTGHLIIVNNFIGFTGDFAKLFEVFIQIGAIIAALWYFRKKLIPYAFGNGVEESTNILTTWKKIIVAIIPALVLGKLFGDAIDAHLFNPTVVAVALIIGGVILIWVERKQLNASVRDMMQLSYRTAFFIGLIQCLALVPGTSRSAATIVGALLLGLARPLAAEFSFFLAIPTLTAASAYSLLKYHDALSGNVGTLAVGTIVAFISALFVIRVFMNYISKKNFIPFGWYRIILGLLIFLPILF